MSLKRLHSLSPQETLPGENCSYRLRSRAAKRRNVSVSESSEPQSTANRFDTNQAVSGQAPNDKVVSMASIIEQVSCGLCSTAITDESLMCVYCHRKYHPNTQCTGLKQISIQCLQEEDDSALQYKCITCRCNVRESPGSTGSTNQGPGSDWQVAVGQVLEIVKALATNMSQMSMTLNNHIQTSASTQASAEAVSRDSNNSPNASEGMVKKNELYAELWEFEERKKRTSSIIVKGTGANNIQEFSDKFRDVHQFLLRSPPQIASTHCIDSAKKIYRVNFQDKASRVSILKEAKNLAGSTHKDVFISRDLTYAQRKDLAAKRAARPRNQRSQDRNSTGEASRSRQQILSGSNTVPISANGRGTGRDSPPPQAGGGAPPFQ